MINLQEEEQIIKDLDNIEGIQIMIQVISLFVCLYVSLLLLLYCTNGVRDVDTCVQLLNTVFHSFLFHDYLEIHVGLIYLLKSLILQRQYDLGTFHSHRL